MEWPDILIFLAGELGVGGEMNFLVADEAVDRMSLVHKFTWPNSLGGVHVHVPVYISKHGAGRYLHSVPHA